MHANKEEKSARLHYEISSIENERTTMEKLNTKIYQQTTAQMKKAATYVDFLCSYYIIMSTIYFAIHRTK